MIKGIILFFALCYSVILLGQQYDYPIKPGTDEWRLLKTHKEQLDVIQIPEDILLKMSTDDLLKTCLNYPLSFDLYAYNTLYEGVSRSVPYFNGFQELLKRKDNFDCLYNYLLREDVRKVTSKYAEPMMIGDKFILNSIVETFLSFDEVMKNTTSEQKEKLAEFTSVVLDYKTQTGIFSEFSHASSTSLLSKIEPEASLVTRSVPVIYTPRGSLVHGIMVKSELTTYERMSILSQLADQYPNATVLASETTSYNCHGYAWHMTTGGEPVWIEGPNQSIYYDDGSYVSTTADDATRVCYVGRDHSAMLAPTTTDVDMFYSKWGSWPLVQHHKDYCPYCPYSSLAYYKLNEEVYIPPPPPPTLSGPATICTSGIFTISNFILGTTVDWVISGGASYLNRTDSTITITKPNYSTQYTTITAIVKRPGLSSVTLSQPLVFWQSGIQNASIHTYGLYFSGGEVYLNPVPPGASNYNWRVEPMDASIGYWDVSPQGAPFAYLSHYYNYEVPQLGLWVTVDFTDVCGQISTIYSSFTIHGSYYSLSPNPATSEVEITLNQQADFSKMGNQKEARQIRTIKVYSLTGNMVLTRDYGTGQTKVTLDTSSLKPGQYSIVISNGEKLETKKLIIK